jgi:hypothetical protein
MRVVEIMMGTPYHCNPETNLGSATELMWIGNCGFLPVVGKDNKVAGVITDRDICVALGTRNRTAGEVRVAEVISEKMYSCAPEDEVQTALENDARRARAPIAGDHKKRSARRDCFDRRRDRAHGEARHRRSVAAFNGGSREGAEGYQRTAIAIGARAGRRLNQRHNQKTKRSRAFEHRIGSDRALLRLSA